MENNNFEISQELEQMREQFRILTEKVEKQNIISEKQLRASMKGKMNSYDFLETWLPITLLVFLCPILMLVTRIACMPDWVLVMDVIYSFLGILILLVK